MEKKIIIDKKYNPYLAKIFSNKVIADLVKYGDSGYFNEILKNSGFMNYLGDDPKFLDVFGEVYKYLSKSYRNEYIYKNAIANKILLGRHSLNTSFMITEFRVENCKADTVILNGTSNVYEIKSELDSLDRLENQICAYQKLFDMVHVISATDQIKKIKQSLPQNVGLMELTPRNTIRTIREAKSGKKTVSPEVIFNSLRKSEYLSIIKKQFGSVPQVPNTEIYKKCKKLFTQLSPEIAHDFMVDHLKRRGNSKTLKDFIKSVPYPLKAFALNSRLKLKEEKNLIEILNTRYERSYSKFI